ncbi:MAG: hypothetical protein QG594_1135 [Bacteroidota bacterium]|nr:hypothetical protein [Bacteroidota bacterium]
MSNERLLTIHDIETAEQDATFSHPVLDVLESYKDKILSIQQQCKPIMDTDQEQTFLGEQFGFLAKAMVEADEFSLTPQELISLWSRDIIKDMSRYQKYTLARIIAASYSVQGIENSQWKQFPVKVTEAFEQAHVFLLESPDIFEVGEHLNERINSLNETVKIVSKSGHAAYPPDKWRDTTINEITENFGNAILPLRMLIENVIG